MLLGLTVMQMWPLSLSLTITQRSKTAQYALGLKPSCLMVLTTWALQKLNGLWFLSVMHNVINSL